MSNFIFNFLLFIVIPIGLYIVLGSFVVYHLGTYGLKNSLAYKAKNIFLFGLIALCIVIILNFCIIKWDDINLKNVLLIQINS